MFSQKKSFFKGKLFYIILIGLFAFGYWINQSPILESPDNVDTDSKIPVETEGSTNDPNNKDSHNIMDNIIGGSNYNSSDDIIENTQEIEDEDEVESKGYYLVKEVDGIIKVFYYDAQGKEEFIRATDIAFSLLSIPDQELFQDGVRKHSIEELNELLQDFES